MDLFLETFDFRAPFTFLPLDLRALFLQVLPAYSLDFSLAVLVELPKCWDVLARLGNDGAALFVSF